jgi:hypothetical protein
MSLQFATPLTLALLIIALFVAQKVIFYGTAIRYGFGINELARLNYLLFKLKIKRKREVLHSKETLNKFLSYINKQKEEKHHLVDTLLLEKIYRLTQQQKVSSTKHLTSSRLLKIGQFFWLTLNKNERSAGYLIENNMDSLVIQLDNRPNQPINRLINLFFYDKNIGYGFQSPFTRYEKTRITLPHSENILQQQKRKHWRKETGGIEAVYYLINPQDEPHSSDMVFNCRILNLSAEGMALQVDGRGEADLYLKVKFLLNNKPVESRGKVCAVTYDSVKNCSILHIQLDSESRFTNREAILSYIYK